MKIDYALAQPGGQSRLPCDLAMPPAKTSARVALDQYAPRELRVTVRRTIARRRYEALRFPDYERAQDRLSGWAEPGAIPGVLA
jgi:hypothetical protein